MALPPDSPATVDLGVSEVAGESINLMSRESIEIRISRYETVSNVIPFVFHVRFCDDTRPMKRDLLSKFMLHIGRPLYAHGL